MRHAVRDHTGSQPALTARSISRRSLGATSGASRRRPVAPSCSRLRRRAVRTEVLEETEGRIAAGVIVLNLVGAECEAFRADERGVFQEQPLGQRQPWVDGLFCHRVTDVLRLDRERVARADARKAALAIHLIGDVVRTMQLREGLAEYRPRST